MEEGLRWFEGIWHLYYQVVIKLIATWLYSQALDQLLLMYIQSSTYFTIKGTFRKLGEMFLFCKSYQGTWGLFSSL